MVCPNECKQLRKHPEPITKVKCKVLCFRNVDQLLHRIAECQRKGSKILPKKMFKVHRISFRRHLQLTERKNNSTLDRTSIMKVGKGDFLFNDTVKHCYPPTFDTTKGRPQKMSRNFG